jgi:hypothetical protein
VFSPCKHFHSGLILEIVEPREEHVKDVSLGYTLGFTCKYQTGHKRLFNNKHTSLVLLFINAEVKKSFIWLTPEDLDYRHDADASTVTQNSSLAGEEGYPNVEVKNVFMNQ